MPAIEQVPEWMRLVGLAAYDRREPGVRVADLESDSLMTPDGAFTRPRVLRFASGAHAVTVDVTPEAGSVSLDIAVSPPRVLRVDVRPIHGHARHVWTDGSGCVACRDVPSGPLSVLVRWPPPIGPVRTAWVQV